MKTLSLEKEITEKGIDPKKLGVFYLSGADIIVGEDASTPSDDELGVTVVKNPKRLFRLQKMTQAGLETQLFIGDLECFEGGGYINVHPQMYYFVKAQPDETQYGIYSLLVTYFKAKVESSARSAGIVLPKGA